MLDMTMGSGIGIGSLCLAIPATVKIIFSAKKTSEPKGANEVLLKVIQKLQETMEDRAATDKERSKTDYEMLKNLIEMNQTAKSTHKKVNDTLSIVKMTEQNTKELSNDSDKIKETVAEIRITQKSIEQRIK